MVLNICERSSVPPIMRLSRNKKPFESTILVFTTLTTLAAENASPEPTATGPPPIALLPPDSAVVVDVLATLASFSAFTVVVATEVGVDVPDDEPVSVLFWFTPFTESVTLLASPEDTTVGAVCGVVDPLLPSIPFVPSVVVEVVVAADGLSEFSMFALPLVEVASTEGIEVFCVGGVETSVLVAADVVACAVASVGAKKELPVIKSIKSADMHRIDARIERNFLPPKPRRCIDIYLCR